MDLQVPFNTKAILVLSAEELESLTINGNSFESSKDEFNLKVEEGSNVILSSGNYNIEYLKS